MRSLLPRIAAGTTGLLAGLAAQRIILHGWVSTIPWIIAAVLAALWWVAEQRAARYRSSLVALTQYCAQDQAENYFVDVVPDEILAEAFPKEAGRG